MDPVAGNPFGVTTFIVAPAILTNASCILSLGTANRLPLAIDLTKTLAAEVEGQRAVGDHAVAPRRPHLTAAKRRVRLLVDALTAFYLSAGLFAATGLLALLGAVSVETHQEVLRSMT